MDRSVEVLALAVAKGCTATSVIATHTPVREPLQSPRRLAGIVAAAA